MGKAVMISIRPEWVAKIATGQKTIEVRKSKPSTLATPFKCYIYCTGGKPLYIGESRYCKEHKRIVRFSEDGKSIPFRNGAVINGTVIGEFTCHNIEWIPGTELDYPGILITETEQSCLTIEQMRQYAGWKENLPPWEKKDLFGWEISDLKIYAQPKKITEFALYGICPYNAKPDIFCTYDGNCFRPDKLSDGHGHGRCWKWMDNPPQSWCYVEELTG